jgi:hypothetical protein
MQHMRAAGDAQCTPFASLCRSLVGWPDGLDCSTDRHACSKRDAVWPSALFAQSFSVMLVDVKFVRERIGTVLFDYLVGAGERHRRRVETQCLRS